MFGLTPRNKINESLCIPPMQIWMWHALIDDGTKSETIGAHPTSLLSAPEAAKAGNPKSAVVADALGMVEFEPRALRAPALHR